ncbi:MAG TPA: efflux RND transporter periplasmic adaptor subunit [Vicinamibacterales bacterium]|nr:efflux RND transporter periplasmic adaptor subunit [Vicinamibacterales bacterium]
MKKLVILLILIAVAGGGAYYYYKYGKTVEKPQVIQATVSRGDIIEVVNATGTLEPMRRVDVGSQVSGVVQQLFVDYNSIVTQGMVLAKIDPSLLQVQVEIQEANIERQQMEIENQKVQLEDLQLQLARTQALFDKQLQNQQQLDASRLAVKNRQAQIASAQKQMVQSEANLRQAKLNVSYTTIVSPIDGVVVERRVDRGQTVQSSTNAPTFFILATDLRTLRLSAGVDEADIGRVEVGQRVVFRVDAYGGQEFEGTVDTVRLNATNTNNVVTYPVWIKVPNPELKLRPSMTATLRVIIQTASNVVRVPNTALRFRPNNDIYTALGLEPPAAGRGRSLASEIANDNNGGRAGAAPGRGREGGQQSAQPGTGREGSQQSAQPGGQQGGQQGAQPGRGGDRMQGGGGQGGNRQPGQGAQNRQGGGTGFGRQTGMANLTPEQIQQFRERYGRGGGGNSGRSGGQGGRGATAQQNATAPPVELTADKIDELFAPVQRPEQRASVYTWTPAKTPPELKQVNIRLGVTDGTFSELLSDNLQVDQQVVTGVLIPQAQRPTQPGQSIFGQPQRGMPGGMMPGGGPGGGGNPGGGGGGGGGGRGGGGRGGD